MPDRRGSRFALEVLFLIALAVALTLADLRPVEIAGIMLAGWVIVAGLEWAAWREQPHYGSGLPPRYYVPQVNLPPAQPLEQVSAGYPEARDEAPTWIASAALRNELLGEWPVAAHDDSSDQPDEQPELDPDPWTRAEELPVAPLGEREVSLDGVPTELEHESAQLAVAVEADPEPQEQPALDVVLVRSAEGVARWSLDPLADQEPRRRFRRGSRLEPAAVEVPARPSGTRALPGRANRQD